MYKFYLIGVIFILTFVFSCKSLGQVDKSEWETDHYFEESQRLSKRDKYREAIKILFEMSERYPNEEMIKFNYHIGMYYMRINKDDIARKYLNAVIVKFEDSELNSFEKSENEKFYKLSNILIEEMENDQYKTDPYRIKEDIEKNKKKRIKASSS